MPNGRTFDADACVAHGAGFFILAVLSRSWSNMDLSGFRSARRSRRVIERFSQGQGFVRAFDSMQVRARTTTEFIQVGPRCKNLYLDSHTKRLFDLTISAIAVTLLSPLLLLIAIGVLATSTGSIFFTQKRGGRGHRSFPMVKFRSMYVQSAQTAVVQATLGDPRATPLGRFLRKTSVDELPQLFNVLKGEMSIVGPRPHAIEHDELYGTLISGYRDRFACRPGITGLAQVNGYRGATPTLDFMARRIELDLQYIEMASLSLDLLIIVRTIWTMLTCRNAY